MTEKKPPEWGDDPLSVFFKDAEYNDRVTALTFPKVFELLGRVHALLKRFEEAIEKDNREQFLLVVSWWCGLILRFWPRFASQ